MMSLENPNSNTLSEGKYCFSELVDVPAFARLLEHFFQVSGIPNGVVDANGELLCMSSGANACEMFHRATPQTAERCRQSNMELVRNLRNGGVAGGICKNGLMDYATPVVVEGHQLATLFLGQVFHKAPDMEFFRAQAEQAGFDESAYLKSIEAIAVVDKKRLDDLMGIMVEMAQMLAASGLNRLRQAALEHDVNTHAERSSQLKAILDFSPVAMGWSEEENRIEYVNHQFTQLFGYTIDDLPDLDTWYRQAYPDAGYRELVVDPWRKGVAQARQNGTLPPELEAEITCKDGSKRSVIVRAAWIGERRQVSFTDITERNRAEAALRASEAKLQGLYALSPIGIALTNMQGQYLEFNEAFQRICGYTRAELNQLDYWALTPKEYAELEAVQLESLNTRGVYGPYEKEYIQKGGHRIPLRLNGVMIHDQNGTPFIWSIVEDITERKRMENVLRASEAQSRDHDRLLQAVLESSPEVIVFALDRDYRYLAFNDKHRATMLAIWGKEIAVGMRMLDVIGTHPDREKAKQGFDRALSDEAFVTEDAYGDEAILRLYWQNFFAPIHGEDGSTIGLTCFVLNISERRRMEQALGERERELRTLVENLPDHITRYTTDARHTYVSPSLEHIFGESKGNLLGCTPTECASDENTQEVERRVRAVAATGVSDQMEYMFPIPNNEARYHLLRFVAERDESNQITGVLGIGTDITERRRTERRMQAHDAMLEMVARDTELLTILNALVEYMEAEDESSRCSILLSDEEGTHLLSSVAPSLPAFYNEAINGIDIRVGVGSCGTSAALRKRVVVEDVQTHEYWIPYRQLAQEAGLQACWSEPILSSKGKVLGTFAIYHAHPQGPRPQDIDRIVFAANLSAIAIENHQVRDELERQAHSDYLTGLDNRRHFLGQAETELARTLRYDRDLSILMIDIDHFKQVNDTYGHKVGDIVLQKFASVCRATLRNIDIIGRIGGEEFAVLLPEAGQEQAMDAAERLCAALAVAQVKLDSGLPLHFTVSLGVVTLEEKDTNIDTLLNQADQALYRAKSQGRNQVCLYQSGVLGSALSPS
ncbi:MAG: diguanylate cyclase [Sideroxydans sp.]|nr:diguanylate cyclase [Sideroxydans sp.]